MKNKNQLIIFEGVELAGKSWLMHQIYDVLERENNKSGKVLDGCAWINADVGVFGTDVGKRYIEKKIELLKEINDRPVLVEKFFISDKVYNLVHNGRLLDYSAVEEELVDMGAKLVLVDVKSDRELFEKRLAERLVGVPHYRRVAKDVDWYLKVKDEYEKEFEASKLDKMRVDLSEIPNDYSVGEVLGWI